MTRGLFATMLERADTKEAIGLNRSRLRSTRPPGAWTNGLAVVPRVVAPASALGANPHLGGGAGSQDASGHYWSSRAEARWFRPMASAVSALSSIVANGHQIVPTAPPPPRFIPYGGFSPVRLEASRDILHPSEAVPDFV